MRHRMCFQISGHASEWGDTCAGADQEYFILKRIGKYEDAMRATQREFTSFVDFVKQVRRPCATLYQYYYQLDYITAIRCGGNAVRSPAPVTLLVDGEI